MRRDGRLFPVEEVRDITMKRRTWTNTDRTLARLLALGALIAHALRGLTGEEAGVLLLTAVVFAVLGLRRPGRLPPAGN